MAGKTADSFRGGMMSSARRSHQPKSREERRRYFDTVIRESGPTVEDFDIAEGGTNVPVPPKQQAGELTPTRKESWFEKYRGEILKGVIILIVVSGLSWFTYQVYSINREVGELTTRVDGVQRHQERNDRELERMEERLRSEIQANTSRIDRLSERPSREVNR